ncbi:MAG: glycosyltransferase [Anaerolineae bacterium]|nr:glycosyltransferase [Anaerolineae bacterium]MDW8067820.1 glycosyltransferase [Anaerolineae bacterium]
MDGEQSPREEDPRKTRILIAYKEFPAPSVGHAGGQGVFRLIQALHRRGHSVVLVARLRREEAPLVEATRPFCERIITVPHHQALGGPLPLRIARSYLALRRAVARILQETRPDLMLVEFTQTALVLLGIRRPFTALRPHDVNWFLMEQRAQYQRGLRRWGTLALAWLLGRLEPGLLRRYDQILAISEGDRRLLTLRCRPTPILLLPLAPTLSVGAPSHPAVPPGANVLFVGAMYRGPNIEAVNWFLSQVWPKVAAEVPEARFYAVGYAPPPHILAHADGERIFVTGYADDLTPWYQAATVFVSPVRVAGGLLQKVLDALAMGVPVVATSVSNHGIGASPGRHLLIADEPEAFAAAVVQLLRDPDLRTQLGRAGQEFVRTRYNLDEALNRWEATWKDRPTRQSRPDLRLSRLQARQQKG